MSYPSYSDLELEIQNLEQENRELKEKVELLDIFLDDRETSIKKLEEENKKLKSDVSVYKSQMNAYEKKYLALLKANTWLEEKNKKLKKRVKDAFLKWLEQWYRDQ